MDYMYSKKEKNHSELRVFLEDLMDEQGLIWVLRVIRFGLAIDINMLVHFYPEYK